MVSTWTELLCLEEQDDGSLLLGISGPELLGSIYELIPHEEVFDNGGELRVPETCYGKKVRLDDNEFLVTSELVPCFNSVEVTKEGLETVSAYCNEHGWDAEPDFKRAWTEIVSAADLGDYATTLPAWFLLANGRGVARDYAEAIKWYSMAAYQGHVRAQTKLAMMYANGEGVSQDYVEAMAWCRKAARRGDLTAQARIGILYAKGHGVPQNMREATKWYRRAASQGEATAQHNLGLLCASGQGVSRSHVQAYKWISLAVIWSLYSDNKENSAATQSRDLLATKMTPAQIKKAQKLARKWRLRRRAVT
jgi:TPR repeat protein